MRKVSSGKQRAIVTAADQLVAEGNDNPTNDEVRAALGGGSIADISPVMRRWRADRKQLATVQLKMPTAISAAGERFAAQLWAAADGEAGKAIEAIRAECASQVTAVEEERDEAFGEIARLEEEGSSLRRALETREREVAEQTAAAERLTEEVHALTVEKERATARAEAAQSGQAQMVEQLKSAQDDQRALQKELMKLAKAVQGSKK